jgi:hypothetical protein
MAYWLTETDPIDALKLIPLPQGVERAITPEPRSDATLYHLLTAVAGAPGEFFEVARPQDGMTLVLFTACILVLDDGGRQASFGSLFHVSAAMSEVQMQRLGELMARAWQWLAESLPRLAFPPAIERMITEATSLRYGDGWTGGGLAQAPSSPVAPQDGGVAQALPARAVAAG